jgi:hypothetical protein
MLLLYFYEDWKSRKIFRKVYKVSQICLKKLFLALHNCTAQRRTISQHNITAQRRTISQHNITAQRRTVERVEKLEVLHGKVPLRPVKKRV